MSVISDLPKVAKVTLKASKPVTEDYSVIFHFYAGTTESQVQYFIDNRRDFLLDFGEDINGELYSYPDNGDMNPKSNPVCNEGICTVVFDTFNEPGGATPPLPPPNPGIDLDNQGLVIIWTNGGRSKLQQDFNDGYISFEFDSGS